MNIVEVKLANHRPFARTEMKRLMDESTREIPSDVALSARPVVVVGGAVKCRREAYPALRSLPLSSTTAIQASKNIERNTIPTEVISSTENPGSPPDISRTA